MPIGPATRRLAGTVATTGQIEVCRPARDIGYAEERNEVVAQIEGVHTGLVGVHESVTELLGGPVESRQRRPEAGGAVPILFRRVRLALRDIDIEQGVVLDCDHAWTELGDRPPHPDVVTVDVDRQQIELRRGHRRRATVAARCRV